MSRLTAAVCVLALASAAAPQARAALITFDFAGAAQLGSALSFTDRSGHYTITARGVSANTGTLDSSFQVTRDGQGLGIRGPGDTSDFIEFNGPNDRLRLDLGGQAFALRDLDVRVDGSGSMLLQLYLGGQGDTGVDGQLNVSTGRVNLQSGPLGVLDFTGGGSGYKLVSINFETGVPLPAAATPVALPPSAALALLALGLAGATRRRRRA